MIPMTRTKRSSLHVSPSPIAVPAPGSAIEGLYSDLDALYNRSISIKCPFFRRRAADSIDNLAMLLQFLLIRHKSLPWVSDLLLDEEGPAPTAFPAPGCKAVGRHVKHNSDGTVHKARLLPLCEVAKMIRSDWVDGSAGPNRGYYITGKLDSAIYRDDCLFMGPDPDMPVRGLRKYLSAASQLFDQRQSSAEMLSIEHIEGGGKFGRGVVEVRWRLGGVLMLPGHPSVEPWTGWTRYHLDEGEGLVSLHEEGWDISVWRAFITTAFPGARDWPWWRIECLDLIDLLP